MAASTRGTLGVADSALLVVGSIVGAGIFFVSPSVAQSVQSPAAFLGAWLLGGPVALAGALTNGELGGLFPRSGGEYVYLREAYGPAFGFLSGWTSFWIGFPGSIAALASGFGVDDRRPPSAWRARAPRSRSASWPSSASRCSTRWACEPASGRRTPCRRPSSRRSRSCSASACWWDATWAASFRSSPPASEHPPGSPWRSSP